MTVFVNKTPHDIVLNNGAIFAPHGTPARVKASFSPFDPATMTCEQVFGEVENLPGPQEGKVYVVSALVLAALKGSRPDCVAPATGHPEARRNDKGQIVSVPGFVR